MTANERRAAYEAAVRGLGPIAEKRLAAGADEESVARELIDLRNKLKAQFREYDDPKVVRLMELRNLQKYGHPLGPDADWLFRKYGNWNAVISAACRSARLS